MHAAGAAPMGAKGAQVAVPAQAQVLGIALLAPEFGVDARPQFQGVRVAGGAAGTGLAQPA